MKASEISKLVEMLSNGVKPVVYFTKKIVELEGYFDPGMRATVIAAYQNVSEESYTVVFDVTDHNDYNVKLEVVNFYGVKESDPKLTASQAGWNPLTRKGGNGSEEYYFAGFDETEYFVLAQSGNTSLYSEFVKSESTSTYVEWLEQSLREARSNATMWEERTFEAKSEIQSLYEGQAGADI